MKRNKGITLIALVITIVVLIILAGVAISLSIGENGIFNKAEYANEQAREETEIGKISNDIDILSNRGQVTLSEEEYKMFKSQFSKNGNVSINKPNTWQVGTEYDFQDGLYGQRFAGTISGTNGYIDLLEASVTNTWDNMVNYGGNVMSLDTSNNEERIQLGMNYSTTYRVDLVTNRRGLELSYIHPAGVTGYDVWVLYTKTTDTATTIE